MNEDVNTLLALLRETGLDWLAVQIEIGIEQARETVTVDEGVGAISETQQPAAMSDEDELRTAIQIVYSNLIEPIRMWDAAEHTIRTEAEGKLVMVDRESELPDPFNPEVRQYATMFQAALAEIWPGGPE